MSYPGYPPAAPPPRSRTGLWVTLAIVVTVVVMSVIGLAVGGLIWLRTSSSEPAAVVPAATPSPGGPSATVPPPTPTPTPTPTPEPPADLAAFCASSINFFTGVDTDYLAQELRAALPNAPLSVQPAIRSMISELETVMSGGNMDTVIYISGKDQLAAVTIEQCGYVPPEYQDRQPGPGAGANPAMLQRRTL